MHLPCPQSPSKLSCQHAEPAPRLRVSGRHILPRQATFGTPGGDCPRVSSIGRSSPTPSPAPGELKHEPAPSPDAERDIAPRNSAGAARAGDTTNSPRPGSAVANFSFASFARCSAAASTSPPSSCPPPSPLQLPTPPQPRAAKQNCVRRVRGSATKRIWRRRKSIFDHKVNIISRLTVCRIKKRPI